MSPDTLAAVSDGDPNPPLNLSRWCLRERAEDPATAHAPAFSFVHEDGRIESWTAAEVWAKVQAVGRGLLAQGLRAGDRVLIRLPHSPAYAFAFFGANVAGLVPIPASPQLTEEEAQFLIDDSEAAATVTTPSLAIRGFAGVQVLESELEALDGPGPLPETRAEDHAYLIYTSGTTSHPKGVIHAQRSVLGRRSVREGWHDFRPGDVTLHAGSLNWSYTLVVGLLDPWWAGAHAVLATGPNDPAKWPRLIERLGVTVFISVPTVYRQMLKYARPEDSDLSSLRHVLCAGEALPPSLLEEWRARVGTEMYECLGMTEVSTFISSGPVSPVRPGSPGKPQPGRRVVALPADGDSTEPLPAGEIGLLAVHRSDPGLMLGYWRREEEQAAIFRGEWFVGGDLISLDEDGYVWFHGRADDVIKSFGYRLSPVEIEKVVQSCPGVLEAAVVGLAIDEGKTLVTACVVPQPGTTLAVGTLEAHVEEHLAEYKRPHQFVFVEALPRTRNGKLLRRELLAQVAGHGQPSHRPRED